MDIYIGELRDAEVINSKDGSEVTIVLTEKDGNNYGSKAGIKMPAESYKMFAESIKDDWLEKKKSLISE